MRLQKKVQELTRVCKERNGSGPRALLGTEVDILPDGSLDYPDDVLARFDVVVAAVHANFHESSREMTARILKAIDNPYVNVIAHPTTRIIGTRDPASFDFERVVCAAKKAGVALEINGSPWRLDLSDTRHTPRSRLVFCSQLAPTRTALHSSLSCALEFYRQGEAGSSLLRS